MFCSNCGTSLGDDVKFCPTCGSASSSTENAPAADPADVAEVNAVQPTEVISEPVAVEPTPVAEPVSEPVSIEPPFAPVEPVSAYVPTEPTSIEPPFTPAEPAHVVSYDVAPEAAPVKKGLPKFLTPVVAGIAIIVAAILIINGLSGGKSSSSNSGSTSAIVLGETSTRLSGTPLAIVTPLSESLLDGSITVGIDYANKYSDEKYSGSVALSANDKNKQSSLAIEATIDGEKLDAELYIDAEALALSSSVFGGNSYGITYKSFASDIDTFLSNADMDGMVDDEMIDMIASYFDTLQSTLDSKTDADVQKLQKDIDSYTKKFINGLSSEKGKSKIAYGGKDVSAKTITYTITPADIEEYIVGAVKLLENSKEFNNLVAAVSESSAALTEATYGYSEDIEDLLDEMYGQLEDIAEMIGDELEGDIILTVTTVKNRVAQIDIAAELEVDREEIAFEASLVLGSSANDTWSFKGELTDPDGDKYKVNLKWTVDESGDEITHKLTVTLDDNGYKESYTFTSKWDTKSGKFTLSAKGDNLDEQIKGTLLVDKNGFEFEFKPDMGNDDISLKINVTATKGAKITKPKFINLDKWDLDELLEDIEDNMGALGGLLGTTAPAAGWTGPDYGYEDWGDYDYSDYDYSDYDYSDYDYSDYDYSDYDYGEYDDYNYDFDWDSFDWENYDWDNYDPNDFT